MTDHLFDAPAPAPPRVPEDVAVVSARVPRTLRRRVIAARRPGETISDVVRRLLELGLSALDLVPIGALDVSAATNTVLANLDNEPRSSAGDPSTSREAAAAAWPGARGMKRALLRELETLGDHGVTSDEARELVGYSGQQRLSDLKLGGWVEPLVRDGVEVRRRTRHRAPAEVLVLTPAARRRLETERAP